VRVPLGEAREETVHVVLEDRVRSTVPVVFQARAGDG
jgi:hypothetical protein